MLKEIIYGQRQAGKTTQVCQRLNQIGWNLKSIYVTYNTDHARSLVRKYPKLFSNIISIGQFKSNYTKYRDIHTFYFEWLDWIQLPQQIKIWLYPRNQAVIFNEYTTNIQDQGDGIHFTHVEAKPIEKKQVKKFGCINPECPCFYNVMSGISSVGGELARPYLCSTCFKRVEELTPQMLVCKESTKKLHELNHKYRQLTGTDINMSQNEIEAMVRKAFEAKKKKDQIDAVNKEMINQTIAILKQYHDSIGTQAECLFGSIQEVKQEVRALLSGLKDEKG